MIGLIVGVVSSILIFTFYKKDQKGVRQHKQKREKQREQKQQEKKKQLQEMQRMKNDPAILKMKQQQKAQFQEKFLSRVDEKDKKIISQYLQKNRNSGKTDQQIIKEASNQTTLFMGFMFIVVVTLVFALLMVNGVQLGQVKNAVLKFLGEFFPKIKQAGTGPTDDL